MKREVAAGRERLAAVSAGLAERFARQAPAAWERFGPAGFARWTALGEGLAAAWPDGALVFFDLPPERLPDLDTAAVWCELGRELARESRRLASLFFERAAPVLAAADAPARLRAWVDTGLRLNATLGWRGSFLAQAFFDAGAAVVAALPAAEIPAWAAAGVALGPAIREHEFFAALPPGLAEWTAGERTALTALVTRLAAASPAHAAAVYRGLPAAVARLDAAVRAALVDVVASVGASLAREVAGLVPVAPALVAAVPGPHRADALALVRGLAARRPEAALAALRRLPRLYEEASAAQVTRWFAVGEELTADNAAAARAYFGLESRTSLRVLRAASTAATLEETQGVWRKLVQMLAGGRVQVRGMEGFSLRPPLEETPASGEVALPERVELLASHEENCRLYRVLAAQLAGRREFGTYARDDVAGAVRDPDAPELLEDMFLLAEGVRVHHRLAAAYPGVAADVRWAAPRVLARAASAAPPRALVVDALLAVAWSDAPRATWPAWLPADAADAVLRLVVPLAAPSATVEDSLRVARALVGALGAPRRTRRQAEAEMLALDDLGILDPGAYADEEAPVGDEPVIVLRTPGGDQDLPEGLRLQLSAPGDEPPGVGRPLSLEELRRLLAAGAEITQATGEGEEGEGLPITELIGKIPAAQLEALKKLLGRLEQRPRRSVRPERDDAPDGPCFLYDEWDHTIADYRSRWCRLYELPVAGDSGEWFGRALLDYAALVPEVRRQFQRLRPEMYRVVRGLEDGEDFDLNAVIDARSERRARRAPSTKLYRSRVREARDVATLFLLDMSASTDEPVEPGRRIIDVTKEALVLMTEALDELGDAYAIYGFSGQGRANVEFYPVKAFNEGLGPAVKGRFGGLEPKRSTRMGTALRHAITKLATVSARSKHLILLSDGFPQDMDYGDDRRSHAYGIRDTAVALREAEAAGITPFCITVDKGGHDYLRQMCDAGRYMVIDDVRALPRELPKIYTRLLQRAVRA